MSREIVEELGQIHDGRVASGVHLVQHVTDARKEDGVLTNAVILSATEHVRNDTPLPFLTFFWNDKEWSCSQDSLSFVNVSNHAKIQ
jgi:hypothetical protein